MHAHLEQESAVDHSARIAAAESAGREFFVSVVDGRRVGLLAGPFNTEGEARSHLPAARREAERIDAYSAFYAFGTVSLPPGSGKRGRLNGALGLEAAGEVKP